MTKIYLEEINKNFKDWLFKNHQGIYDVFKNDPNIHGSRLVYVMLANEVWEHLEKQIEGMKCCGNCSLRDTSAEQCNYCYENEYWKLRER